MLDNQFEWHFENLGICGNKIKKYCTEVIFFLCAVTNCNCYCVNLHMEAWVGRVYN